MDSKNDGDTPSSTETLSTPPELHFIIFDPMSTDLSSYPGTRAVHKLVVLKGLEGFSHEIRVL